MGKATNLRPKETYVRKAKPRRNFVDARRLIVASNEGNVAGMDSFGYLTFPRPFPLGARILKATLTFYTWAIEEGGAHTFEVRPVDERFAYTRVNWENRPRANFSRKVEQTKRGKLPTHEPWVFDVTRDMQKVSDGEEWYGWRITTGDKIPRSIVAREAEGISANFRPTLTIEWSDQPDEPASLSPDGGVVGISTPALEFEYIPIDPDATLQKVRVQFSYSPSFAAPLWDSGQRDWTEETVFPEDLGFEGVAEDRPTYWRIRVMDAGGWSRWSDAAVFRYIPVPGLTMTAPVQEDFTGKYGNSIIAHGYISDATPQISWVSPGQESYRVSVSLTTSSFDIDERIWDSGRIWSTDNSIEIPKGVFTRDDVEYRIIVRAFDKHERISVANNPLTYSGARVIVQMTDDPEITAVKNIDPRQVEHSPNVWVYWERGTSADEYQIIRDGINDIGSSRRVIVDQVAHEDLVTESGRLRYLDRGAPPRTPFAYAIYPVENGKRGKGTRGSRFETRLDGIWLIMTGGLTLAIMGNEQGEWDLPEQTTAHQVIGAKSPTIIREAHQGYQGSLGGVLVEESIHQPGLTAQMKRDRFLAIKDDPRGVRLVVGDLNIPVQLANLNVYPMPTSEQQYECSFDFWQSGEFWWNRL